jgi:hypothetical protein
MKNKNGQFYIVAAIIIALIISGLATVATYSYARAPPVNIKDLSSNLKEETPRILDYGVYNGKDIYSLMRNFTAGDFASYFLEKTDYNNAIFIYGDKKKLYKVEYLKKNTGEISVIGDASIPIQRSDVKETEITTKISKDEDGNEIIEVEILKNTYNFKLRDNEMFYFVISKQNNEETFVEKN